MTIFATASDAWPILGIGLAALAACAIPMLLARWTVKSARVAQRLPRAGRIATAAMLVIAGTPLYIWTFFAIMIGLATYGCPPDAYECPF